MHQAFHSTDTRSSLMSSHFTHRSVGGGGGDLRLEVSDGKVIIQFVPNTFFLL